MTKNKKYILCTGALMAAIAVVTNGFCCWSLAEGDFLKLFGLLVLSSTGALSFFLMLPVFFIYNFSAVFFTVVSIAYLPVLLGDLVISIGYLTGIGFSTAFMNFMAHAVGLNAVWCVLVLVCLASICIYSWNDESKLFES